MMKMKTVLVSALSILALGTAALVNAQGVMADTPNIAKSDYDPANVKHLKVQMSLSQDTSSGKLKITASIDTFPEGMNEVSIPFFLFNVKTQVTEKFPGLADAVFTPSQPSVTREYDMNQANLNAFADGEYRIDIIVIMVTLTLLLSKTIKWLEQEVISIMQKMVGTVIHTIRMALRQETNIFSVLIEEEYIM